MLRRWSWPCKCCEMTRARFAGVQELVPVPALLPLGAHHGAVRLDSRRLDLRPLRPPSGPAILPQGASHTAGYFRWLFGAAKKRTTERKGSSHVDWNYHLYDFFPDQEFYRKLVGGMSSSVYLGSLIRWARALFRSKVEGCVPWTQNVNLSMVGHPE